MTITLKKQTKEIEKGTLVIAKELEKYSQRPYYIGYLKSKNLAYAQVIIKRFSRISFKELESRI